MEPDLSILIKKMQQYPNVKCFGLTSRLSKHSETTIKSLEQLEISFFASHPFPNYSIMDLTTEAKCTNGILFTNKKDKGTMLVHLLRYMKRTSLKNTIGCEVLIFIDNLYSNIESILRKAQILCHEFGIQEIYGFHYTKKCKQDLPRPLTDEELYFQLQTFIQYQIILDDQTVLNSHTITTTKT